MILTTIKVEGIKIGGVVRIVVFQVDEQGREHIRTSYSDENKLI